MPEKSLPAILESNLREVRADLERAAARAGREATDVRLLAVTKSVEPEVALSLARLGCLDMAENRLEGLQRKRALFEATGTEVRWHFIGHLQSNKARKVLQSAEVLHSVDSQKLLTTISRIAAEEDLRPEIYLEVKLSGESEKHGLDPSELGACVRTAGEDPRLRLRGLMTMAPRPIPGEDAGQSARACFDQLAVLARSLEEDPELARAFVDRKVELSMGMSGDYEQAIAAGATTCRIGSALFRGLDEHEGACA